MVYVTGDMHGDYALFSQKNFKNIKEGDTLIVCGDFGFIWRGDSKEKKILERVAHTCPVHLSLHPDVKQNFVFNWQ